jgi:small subunit ribosomal protein S8
MTNYPLGDFLIRIKNAALARGKEVLVPSTKQIKTVASALKRAGYLEEIGQEKEFLKVSITYKRKKPLMMGLKLISRPGLRIYMGVSQIEKKRGPSILLVSTPKGILTSREAVKERLGGEVLVEVW